MNNVLWIWCWLEFPTRELARCLTGTSRLLAFGLLFLSTIRCWSLFGIVYVVWCPRNLACHFERISRARRSQRGWFGCKGVEVRLLFLCAMSKIICSWLQRRLNVSCWVLQCFLRVNFCLALLFPLTVLLLLSIYSFFNSHCLSTLRSIDLMFECSTRRPSWWPFNTLCLFLFLFRLSYL